MKFQMLVIWTQVRKVLILMDLWLERWAKWLLVPVAIGTIMAVVIGINNSNDLSEEAKIRAAQAEQKIERDREVNCVAYTSVSRIDSKAIPAQTNVGAGLQDNVQVVVDAFNEAAKALDCDSLPQTAVGQGATK